jgi:hypothetical protein
MKMINYIKWIGFIVKETFLHPLSLTVYMIDDHYNISEVERINWKKGVK